MLPGVKLGKGMGGKGVSAEGQHRQPRAGLKASSSLYRHRPSEHTVSHDVTAGRNWAKIWISVLFLTAACESTVISKKKKKFTQMKKKHSYLGSCGRTASGPDPSRQLASADLLMPRWLCYRQYVLPAFSLSLSSFILSFKR